MKIMARTDKHQGFFISLETQTLKVRERKIFVDSSPTPINNLIGTASVFFIRLLINKKSLNNVFLKLLTINFKNFDEALTYEGKSQMFM